MELVNDPVPVPLLVELALGIVKPGEVPQSTPRAVTDEPPVAVTLPPEVAVKLAKALSVVVVTVGTENKEPLTATFTLVAPVDEHTMFPLAGADATAAMRA